MLLRHRDVKLFRQAFQNGGGAAGGGEDLVFFSAGVHGQGHGDGFRLEQKALQHQPLLGGKVSETVDIEVLPFTEGAVPQLFRQTGEPVPGIQAAPCGHGLAGSEDEP